MEPLQDKVERKRSEQRVLRDRGKERAGPPKGAKPEATSDLGEGPRKTPSHPADSPVLELPGATVVPGATPAVPETQSVSGRHGDQGLSPQGLPLAPLEAPWGYVKGPFHSPR